MTESFDEPQNGLLAGADAPDFKNQSKSTSFYERGHISDRAWNVHDFASDDELYPPLSLMGLGEEIMSYFAEYLQQLRNEDIIKPMREHLFKIGDIINDPMFENELQYVTAVGLMCYGGSWTYLCSFIAAVDVFDTVKVIEEGCSICSMPFSESSPNEEDVTPKRIKSSIRNMGLQWALMVAVAMSPTIAGICIVSAFASKITCLLPVKEIVKFSSTDAFVSNAEDLPSHVNDQWLEQISFAVSFILSLFLFGCFPQFVVAMYMCFLGLSMLLEAISNPDDVLMVSSPLSPEFKVNVSNWMLGASKHMKWGFTITMSMWQAWYDYTGIFQLFSWFILLFPAVHFYNLVTSEAESNTIF